MNRKASLLVFGLGSADDAERDTRFGIDVTQALQVFEPEVLWPVPLAPKMVLGIVNHHGRIVTVIDPAVPLDTSASGLGGAESRVILLRHGQLSTGNLGLFVWRVHEIVPPAGLKAVDVPAGKCVEWVAQHGDHLINIVRVESLLEEVVRQFEPIEANTPRQAG